MDGLQSAQTSNRVPAAVRVRRFGNGDYRSVNLSEGGVFVATGETLPAGTWVELGIQLGGALSTREIVTSAQVAWSNDPRTPSSPHLPAGMGLEFVGLDPESQSVLREYVEGLRRAARESARRTTVRQPGKKKKTKRKAELLSPGECLGPYEIRDVLGVGGMGTVYLAEHTRLGRPVALKKLHRRFTQDAVAARRFFDEARLVNRIGHANIVEVFDFVCEGRDHYFVMELLDGEPLGRLIVEEAPIASERIISIARQLCDVLGAVHARDVVHRDLKPDNIVLIQRGANPDFVKLLDFGIAKLRAPVEDLTPAQTAAGVVLGTPGYVAPEAVGGKPVDARCDIYALGVILFQLASGRPPFEGSWGQVMVKQATEIPPSPSTFRSHPLPSALDELILRCLDPDPKCRPQTVEDAHARLRDCVHRPQARQHPRRRRRPGVLFGGTLIAAIAGAVALVPTSSDAPPPTRPTRAPPPIEEPAPASVVPPTRARTPSRRRKLTMRERYRRGVASLERGDAMRAAGELERVVRARPYHARAHRALGKAYLLLGRETEAFEVLARYVELVPNAPDSPRLRELIARFREAH